MSNVISLVDRIKKAQPKIESNELLSKEQKIAKALQAQEATSPYAVLRSMSTGASSRSRQDQLKRFVDSVAKQQAERDAAAAKNQDSK